MLLRSATCSAIHLLAVSPHPPLRLLALELRHPFGLPSGALELVSRFCQQTSVDLTEV